MKRHTGVEFKTHSTSWSTFTANQEIPSFIEHNDSLPCSLQHANFPYPNPYQSNPCPPILPFNDPFQYYALISVPVCIWSLSFRFPYQNLYVCLFSSITAIFPAHLILLPLVSLIIQDANQKSPKFEQMCAAMNLEPFVNQSAKQRCAVGACIFSVYFFDVVSVLFCSRTDQLKWIIWRSNGFCIKFCFKLRKRAAETHKMLKEAFGDNALGQTQTYEWLYDEKCKSRNSSLFIFLHALSLPPFET